jgi:hypothetical protein
MLERTQLQKKANCGYEPEGTWYQDVLTGDNPLIISISDRL